MALNVTAADVNRQSIFNLAYESSMVLSGSGKYHPQVGICQQERNVNLLGLSLANICLVGKMKQ